MTDGTTRAGRRGTLLVVAAVAVGCVAGVRTFVAEPVRIASASMAPGLVEGDLVVFDDPRDHRRTLKRVVGLPGEEVVVLDGVLHVDGRPVSEPWVDPDTVDGSYTRTFRVPPDHVLVLGDNRANSVDSRDYGAVAAEDLRGRVVLGS